MGLLTNLIVFGYFLLKGTTTLTGDLQTRVLSLKTSVFARVLEGKGGPHSREVPKLCSSASESTATAGTSVPPSSATLRADILCSTLLMLKGGARASRAGKASVLQTAQAAEPGRDLPQIPVATAILSTGSCLCYSGPELHGLFHGSQGDP